MYMCHGIELQYGMPVEITHCYDRKVGYRKIGSREGNYKFWHEVKLIHPYSGIFLGVRNLKNGWVSGSGLFNGFEVDEKIVAGLVSPGPRRNPVLVPIDKIKILLPMSSGFGIGGV